MKMVRTPFLLPTVFLICFRGASFAQNTSETFCKLIPGVSSLPVYSTLKTIASCTLPCFNFDPGNKNTLITYEGSNEIAFTYSKFAIPSQIDVNLRLTCLGANAPADIHTYTIFNGSAHGATITAIGEITGGDRADFDPLAPGNPWCGAKPNGCTIQLQMDAVTPGDSGISVITNPPSAGHSDTAVLVKAVPLTN
jgi:hypothetical protein